MQALIERLWAEIGFTGVLVTHDVEEAVALADRVVVLEGGRVALDLPVALPRPRARHQAAFGAVVASVLARLGAGEMVAPPRDVAA
jgi:sulfonate transport system ATP-binding protein